MNIHKTVGTIVIGMLVMMAFVGLSAAADRSGMMWVYQGSSGSDDVYTERLIVLGDDNEAYGDVSQAIQIFGSGNNITLTNVVGVNTGGIYIHGHSNTIYLPANSDPYVGNYGYDNVVYVGMYQIL